MSAVALQQPARDSHSSRQARVAALLESIEERRQELYRLRAHGVTFAALAERKQELNTIRRKLAATVATTTAP